jgi:hypothetical protein
VTVRAAGFAMFVRSLIGALAVATSGCVTVSTSGHVAADGRLFFEKPKYDGQAQGSAVSLVAEPELDIKSDDEVQSVALRPFYRLDPVDDQRTHADVRKATYQVAFENFEAGAGAGQFAWGVLESYRPTDVINQIDFVEAPTANAKLGQPYVEVGWSADSTSLRLYYLPYFRDRTFPGLRGRLRFPAVIDTSAPSFDSRYGRFHPSGAARLSTSIDKVDLGLGLFTGLSREPRFLLELTTGQVVPRYDVIHQASGDVQWTVGDFVFKAEAYARLWPEGRRAYAGGGGGLDYNIPDLAFGWDLTLALEFLFDLRPVDAPPTFFDHDAFAGVRLAFNDPASSEVLGGAIVDVGDGTTFGRLAVARRFGDHWRASIDGNLFLGPSGKIESGFLRDDYAAARLAYFF